MISIVKKKDRKHNKGSNEHVKGNKYQLIFVSTEESTNVQHVLIHPCINRKKHQA